MFDYKTLDSLVVRVNNAISRCTSFANDGIYSWQSKYTSELSPHVGATDDNSLEQCFHKNLGSRDFETIDKFLEIQNIIMEEIESMQTVDQYMHSTHRQFELIIRDFYCLKSQQWKSNQLIPWLENVDCKRTRHNITKLILFFKWSVLNEKYIEMEYIRSIYYPIVRIALQSRYGEPNNWPYDDIEVINKFLGIQNAIMSEIKNANDIQALENSMYYKFAEFVKHNFCTTIDGWKTNVLQNALESVGNSNNVNRYKQRLAVFFKWCHAKNKFISVKYIKFYFEPTVKVALMTRYAQFNLAKCDQSLQQLKGAIKHLDILIKECFAITRRDNINTNAIKSDKVFSNLLKNSNCSDIIRSSKKFEIECHEFEKSIHKQCFDHGYVLDLVVQLFDKKTIFDQQIINFMTKIFEKTLWKESIISFVDDDSSETEYEVDESNLDIIPDSEDENNTFFENQIGNIE
ncbi:hypothetical protein [Neodiprion abietis nucleopolyhedrovirus]|uniref:Uncharacterized protein n=1 Tax=Neodiprion abietis nucleopolyhedrovirus TaxID=204507 RepID=Q0ZNY9_9CBAC|nr:hypothetical protein [Neodiprion abietis nucleopolyhedrovirus]ABC74965.1 unknown [Neodiprion abietis nucleopolyhedrovirus]